jgi:hypothetical protein
VSIIVIHVTAHHRPQGRTGARTGEYVCMCVCVYVCVCISMSMYVCITIIDNRTQLYTIILTIYIYIYTTYNAYLSDTCCMTYETDPGDHLRPLLSVF